MLTEQKNLLADVRALTDDALKLYNRGVKIGGVVKNLRSAGDELATRVRFLEREAKPKKAATQKPAKKENPAEVLPPTP